MSGRGALLLLVSMAGLLSCGCPEEPRPSGTGTDPGPLLAAPSPTASPDGFPCSRPCRAVLAPELADDASARLLVKHHLLPALQAAEVREALGPDGLAGVDGFALIGELAEDLYLAAPALAELERPPLLDEAEVEARYADEAHRWVVPGRVAFVQAWLRPAGGREAEEAARAAVSEFYDQLRAGGQPDKRSEPLFSLNHEPLRAIPPGAPLYELVGAPVGTLAGPFPGGPPVVALVTASEPETRRPLEEVRAEVEAELVAEELERRRRSLAERAARRFPVALAPGFGAISLADGGLLGRVGARPIDLHLMVAIQALRPAFHLDRDPAAFEALLVEHYSVPRTLAAEERERGGHESDATAAELAQVRRMAEDRLLARRWWERAGRRGVADEARARGWYDDHPERWLVPGDVDVLIALLDDRAPGTAAAARAELELRTERGEFDRHLKAHGDGYTVVLEPGVTPAWAELYAAVEGLEPGEVSEPAPLGQRTILATPTRRTPDRVVPFEEVRDQCAIQAGQEEVERRLAELERRARELVPPGFE